MAKAVKNIVMEEIKVMRNAITGKPIIWIINPINKDSGSIKIFLKLEGVNDKPIPIIISISTELIRRSI